MLLKDRSCADIRDQFFAIAAFPEFHSTSQIDALPIGYDMSNEEICAVAFSFFEQLVQREKGRRIDRGAEAGNRSREDLLLWIIGWLLSQKDHQNGLPGEKVALPALRFQEWLLERVDVDSAVIRLASDRTIDYSVGVLSWLLEDTLGTILLRMEHIFREDDSSRESQESSTRTTRPPVQSVDGGHPLNPETADRNP